MTTCQHDPMFTTDGRCSKCYPPKRVIMVQHINGTQEIDQAHTIDGDHLHQCGWCGEWYTGARVDHGCPPEPVSAMEQDYIESFDTTHPGWIVNPAVTLPEAQHQADAKMAEYHLTNQPLTGDSVNDALIAAANAHNVIAFEWRRTHPDWRTRR